MTLKDDWETGETFTADDANELAAAVNTAATEASTALTAIQSLAPTDVGQALIAAADEAEARETIGASGHLYVNVKDYGAVGDGVADDTAAIEAAFSVNGGIYFPPGTYNYTGTGLTGNNSPTIKGAGRNETFIDLDGGDYLLDISVQLVRLDVQDISFYRGKGAIRHTYASSNVTYKHSVERCNFHEYTECAIASDGSDMPYWNIRNCLFDSANTTGTIGIALGGGTDQCVIDSCSFIRNRVHITASLGNNLQITNCDFLQFSTVATSGPRAAVWIRPGASSSNSGPGLVVRSCKFGNEGLVAGDYRILYADQDTGTHNGNKFPKLSADSTGYIIGHRIVNCQIMSIGGAEHPVVYSTTPNVRGIAITDCFDDGSAYLLQYRTVPSVPSAGSTLNVFGPIIGPGVSTTARITRISNAVGVGYVDDPAGTLPDNSLVRGYGSSAGYSSLIASTVEADDFFVLGSAVVTADTDVLGGTNAAKYTFTGSPDSVFRTISAMTPDVPVFIEFDLKNPNDGSELDAITVFLWDYNSYYHFTRRVEVPSVAQGWVTYRFHFTPRTAGATPRFHFTGTPANYAGTVIVGRPRIYHGHAYQLGGHRPAIAAAATDAATTQTLANDLRSKLIDLGIIEA